MHFFAAICSNRNISVFSSIENLCNAVTESFTTYSQNNPLKFCCTRINNFHSMVRVLCSVQDCEQTVWNSGVWPKSTQMEFLRCWYWSLLRRRYYVPWLNYAKHASFASRNTITKNAINILYLRIASWVQGILCGNWKANLIMLDVHEASFFLTDGNKYCIWIAIRQSQHNANRHFSR